MDYVQKPLRRGAGTLLPISSLPSPYGIGSFSQEAYDFVDFLVKAGQTYWQILPLCPTNFGDSPYQSASAFAGNPYFIDLDAFIREGLLSKDEVESIDWGEDPANVDYEILYENRFRLLHKAFSKSNHYRDKKFRAFCDKNRDWLEEYALFMAIKDTQFGGSWDVWPKELRFRESAALEKAKSDLKEEISFWRFLQFRFSLQWEALKNYANSKGVRIIGDIPIYVAYDSSDVWEYYSFFQLDEQRNPEKVAGVPPDCFSTTGQLWGNPLYDWDAMKKDNFAWWKRRIAQCARLYDVVRIDHFIGIANYYSIDATEATAKDGEWKEGPGADLLKAITEVKGDLQIIAEDLGNVTDKVRNLMKEFGFPGMKILQMAFDGSPRNTNLPHTYQKNMVVYGGTHDNDTLVGFLSLQESGPREFTEKYLDIENPILLPKAIIRAGYASVADVVVFQVQDYLELGNEARMNSPATLGINWKWRLLKGQLPTTLAERLSSMAEVYDR
ncbi:MAG: 4-alpha-glucanotransferase [Lachnospiraceae bacterium]|jgi:4-alpha-glucanotransferase|nr:4-alpha-glucanotransferase [Lachnospiraceae bacterium]